ncbi:hypothetical protein PHMEG_0007600 [Phytophthora megakarya]|uniref:Uncharacterized protein n=1 Tax=Phytophthora megakarya TaxID=4795 RepID=A0A225WN47_9STRA|nr:hypothetical protein PHMEG_0007600 [Phytophthora megakarya]
MDCKTRYGVRELHLTKYDPSCGSDGLALYHVNTWNYHYSGVFMRAMLLSCRHVMYWRLTNNKIAILIHHIAPRWTLSYSLNQPVEQEDVPENGVACRTFQVHESAMTSKHIKFRMARQSTSTRCSVGKASLTS